MIFFSVADACRHLGIDPKTLHRWLAHAHLSLQAHPGDGRKHGLREDP
jgi:transposase-like protein